MIDLGDKAGILWIFSCYYALRAWQRVVNF